MALRGTFALRRLALALAEPLQEPVQGLSIRGAHRGVVGFLQDKLETDAVLAQAHGTGVNADGALGDFFPEGGVLQGHQDQRAGIPALLGDHIQAG